jgi:peptidoglycan/xylan/chitin deacetylase (PgdA/CDA1 family)
MTALGNLKGALRSLLFRPYHSLLNAIDAPVIVLVYHRVTTLASDAEMLAVTPENFRSQMQYLKANFPVVRFEEEWKGRGPAIAVTFDDGYADNALEALPILEEVGVPATFFVSTGRIGTEQQFWWHELEEIFLGDRPLPAKFSPEDNRLGKSWPAASRQQRQESYHGLVRLSNDAAPDLRERCLTRLRNWAGTAGAGNGASRSMNLEELRRLAQSPWVTIGAHTITHSRLSALSPDAQRQEIVTSKTDLEARLAREITVFSYPFGRKCDYTRETAALCREAGFVRTAANFPGQAHRWTDPHQIPRHLVRDWSVDEFAARLRGFWTR